MHPVRRPALVHPAFENTAVSSGTNLHIASPHRPARRPLATWVESVLGPNCVRDASHAPAIFLMLTHGPCHRALNWPTGGAR